ncbi:hypothetical protein ACF8PL_21180 [Delftia sp. WSY_4]|uniref:hypothetical protein n=1 Tax=unclassified Delftia TaxID=2613839 RepID=UPI00370A7148
MRSTLEPGAVQHLQRRINAARGRSMQEDLAQPHHVIEHGGGPASSSVHRFLV